MEETIKILSELDFAGKSRCIVELSEFQSTYFFLEQQYKRHLEDIGRLTSIAKENNDAKKKIQSLEEEIFILKAENQDLKKALEAFIRLAE